MNRQRLTSGFTLIELLIAMSIAALLVTITVPVYGYLKAKAAGAVCAGNLRVLGTALNAYMIDHDRIWPQQPEGGFSREADEWHWWEETLKPYDMAQNHWICPADDDRASVSPKNRGRDTDFSGSYLVTDFDAEPGAAFRWKQPWAVERGGFHGQKAGPNLLMPDGSIQQGISLPPIPH